MYAIRSYYVLDMALSSVFEKHMTLIKALAIYLVLMIIVDYVNINNIVHVDGALETKSGLLFFITFVANWMIYIMVAITSHRILILGENSIPEWGLYYLTKRECRITSYNVCYTKLLRTL